jgi:hypothetical protein
VAFLGTSCCSATISFSSGFAPNSVAFTFTS